MLGDGTECQFIKEPQPVYDRAQVGRGVKGWLGDRPKCFAPAAATRCL